MLHLSLGDTPPDPECTRPPQAQLPVAGAFYRLTPSPDDLAGPSGLSRWLERLLGAGLLLAVGAMTLLTAHLLTSPNQPISQPIAVAADAPMGRALPFNAPPKDNDDAAAATGNHGNGGDNGNASLVAQQAFFWHTDQLNAGLLAFNNSSASLPDDPAIVLGPSDTFPADQRAWGLPGKAGDRAAMLRWRDGSPLAAELHSGFSSRRGEEDSAAFAPQLFFVGIDHPAMAEPGLFALSGSSLPMTSAAGGDAFSPTFLPPRFLQPAEAPTLADNPLFHGPRSSARWPETLPGKSMTGQVTSFAFPAVAPTAPVGAVGDETDLAADPSDRAATGFGLVPAAVPEPCSLSLVGICLMAVAAVMAARLQGLRPSSTS